MGREEVDLQRKLSLHPNIVRFLGACCHIPSLKDTAKGPRFGRGQGLPQVRLVCPRLITSLCARARGCVCAQAHLLLALLVLLVLSTRSVCGKWPVSKP